MISGPGIGRKLFTVLMGTAVTCLLFSFMPLSWPVFQRQIRELPVLRSGNPVSSASSSVALPGQKQKKLIEPRLKERESQNIFMENRFSMDLSVLSEGDWTGETAAGGGIIDEREADTPPVKRYAVPPIYPAAARDRGVEGTVVARILIGEDGSVHQVEILEATSGYGFERAVINAVMKWKFQPARLENMPVRVWARQEIRFSL